MPAQRQLAPIPTPILLPLPLPQVLDQVSSALQDAGFGLLTIMDIPATGQPGDLVCEITVIEADRTPSRILPWTICLRVQGDRTRVSMTWPGLSTGSLAGCGTRDAAAVWAGVAQGITNHSMQEKELVRAQ